MNFRPTKWSILSTLPARQWSQTSERPSRKTGGAVHAAVSFRLPTCLSLMAILNVLCVMRKVGDRFIPGGDTQRAVKGSVPGMGH